MTAAQERVDAYTDPSELGGRFDLYGHLAVVASLEGYIGGPDAPTPIWGDPVMVYNPVTSKLTELDEAAWRVFRGIASDADVGAKSLQTDSVYLPDDHVQQITDRLLSESVILPKGQEVNVSLGSLGKRHEMYVNLTRLCNLRCEGCAVHIDQEYEAAVAKAEGEQPSYRRILPLVDIDGDPVRTTMSENVLDTLLEGGAKSAQLRKMESVNIKWAGGEPLMPKSRQLIVRAQEKIASLREKYPDIDFTQVIITNGTFLDQDTVDQIKGMGQDMHVSVSLWGLGKTHEDARGVMRNKDSFKNTVDGIGRLHEAGIKYSIHHVVTPDNAAEFGKFIEAVWDIESDGFLGKEWKWLNGPCPLPVTISFFRAQTEEQLAMLNARGYQRMVNGLRGGFEVIRGLIARGIPIKTLGRIDYFDPFSVKPTVCGSGDSYAAVGVNGEIESCHEALSGAGSSLSRLQAGEPLMQIASSEYAGQLGRLIGVGIEMPDDMDPVTATTLKLHGGTGCPRTSRAENDGQLGKAASTASQLYAPIWREWVALEAMRRLASERRQMTAA